MDMNAVNQYINPNLLILVPVLYIIGMAIRSSLNIDNKHIPLILGIISVVLCLFSLFATTEVAGAADVFNLIFAGVTQGIIVAGTSVYANQLYKQNTTKG